MKPKIKFTKEEKRIIESCMDEKCDFYAILSGKNKKDKDLNKLFKKIEIICIKVNKWIEEND